MSSVSASETVQCGKYKVTLSDNQINKLYAGYNVEGNLKSQYLMTPYYKLAYKYVKKPIYKKVTYYKKYFKYYMYCKNGKSLGKYYNAPAWYFSSPTKPRKKDLRDIQRHIGGKITYKKVYGKKKVTKKVKTKKYKKVKKSYFKHCGKTKQLCKGYWWAMPIGDDKMRLEVRYYHNTKKNQYHGASYSHVIYVPIP